MKIDLTAKERVGIYKAVKYYLETSCARVYEEALYDVKTKLERSAADEPE